jgi:hypothetical protein
MEPTHEFYTKLTDAVKFFNGELFDGSLPEVIITVQRNQRAIAYFDPDRWTHSARGKVHEISINPTLLASSTLIDVFKGLVFQMCRCWQQAHGSPTRANYHNRDLADKLKAIGLQPTATGKKGGRETGQKMMCLVISSGPFMQAALKLIEEEQWSMPWVDRETSAESLLEEISFFVDDDGDDLEAESPSESEPEMSAMPPGAEADEESLTRDALPMRAAPQGEMPSIPDSEMEPEPEPTPTPSPVKPRNPIEKVATNIPGASVETVRKLVADRAVDHVDKTSLQEKKKRVAVKSKTKYQCYCNLNVWGKPNLYIRCETCNELFVEGGISEADMAAYHEKNQSREPVEALTPTDESVVDGVFAEDDDQPALEAEAV